MQSQFLATVLVILGAFGWSVRDVVTKQIPKTTPAVEVAAIAAFALIINTLTMIGKECAGFGCAERLPLREQIWLAARCLCGPLSVASTVMALKRLDLAIFGMIHCTSPLFVIFLGRLFLGERIVPLSYACIGIAVVGLVLNMQPWKNDDDKGSVQNTPYGYALAWVSSLSAAVSYTALRALHSLSATTTLMAFFSTMLIVGFLVSLTQEYTKPSSTQLMGFASLSLIMYGSEVAITKGYALATNGAGSVAVFKFLTPVFAIMWDIIIYQKFPNVLAIVGAALVLGGSAAMVKVQSHGKGSTKEADCSHAEMSDVDSGSDDSE